MAPPACSITASGNCCCLITTMVVLLSENPFTHIKMIHLMAIYLCLSFNQCVRGGALVPSGGGQDDSWKPKHTQTSRLFCLSCFFSLCSDIFLSCEILACVQHFWRDTWLLQESQITIHSVTDQRQKTQNNSCSPGRNLLTFSSARE